MLPLVKFVMPFVCIYSYEKCVQATLDYKKSKVDHIKTNIEQINKTTAVFDKAINEEANPKAKKEKEEGKQEYLAIGGKVYIPFKGDVTIEEAEKLKTLDEESYKKIQKFSLMYQFNKLIVFKKSEL